jgi:hypothetical protein
LEKMVGAVGFEPTFSGFSSSFMVAFRCSFTRLPTDHDTSVSLVWQALFRINRQQSAEKCVSPGVARFGLCRDCVVIKSGRFLCQIVSAGAGAVFPLPDNRNAVPGPSVREVGPILEGSASRVAFDLAARA